MKSCFISNSDHAIGVLVSFTVFVKFVRNAVGCTMIIVGTLQISIYTYMYYNGLCVVLYLVHVKRSTVNDHKIAIIGCDRLNKVS